MLSNSHKQEVVAMRDAYCKALMLEAQKNDKIIALEADVMHSMGTVDFAKKFPSRSINCGIQEANIVCVAAGLSVRGFTPFFHTFGIFATRRVFDQVFVSGAYAHTNIKIIGGDAGVTAALNGGTHMPLEDMGIMRTIPTMTIIEPADSTAISKLVAEITNTNGIMYMRSCRKNVKKIYNENATFKLGKANVLRQGTDVTIIACGIMVYEALMAADTLANEGISAMVVDMFTIKPIDVDCILDCVKKTGAIVTAENHNIINGLGSAVCEVVSEHIPVPVERVGVQDHFGEVGNQDYLMEKFGLTASVIVAKAKRAIERKR